MNTVWVVDDDASIRWVLVRALRSEGFNVTDFENAEAALGELKRTTPDVLMTDIRMPGMSGLELAQSLRRTHADLPCIVMTAHTDLDSAIASYESGAFEYLPKPFDLDDAVRLVQSAVQTSSENRPHPESNGDVELEIIGEAPAMQEVFRVIGRLSTSDINVLVCGQSGTGKALVAKTLHRHSPRAKQTFVSVNLAAIPAELLEVELFGHEKEAFDGAEQERQGLFEQAHEGTIFLDEISQLNSDLQTRLLRVMTDGGFYRVGSRELRRVDVRVLSASPMELESLVESGAFREDLYHRLNVIRIDLPPLKDRAEDVPLLAKRFLRLGAKELGVDMKSLSDSALVKLMAYEWPGNVRELENMCRRFTVMTPSSVVSDEDLPKELSLINVDDQPKDWEVALAKLVRQKLNRGQHDVSEDLTRRFEAILLKVALAHSAGHRQNAARMLGWGRNTLTRKLKDLKLG